MKLKKYKKNDRKAFVSTLVLPNITRNGITFPTEIKRTRIAKYAGNWEYICPKINEDTPLENLIVWLGEQATRRILTRWIELESQKVTEFVKVYPKVNTLENNIKDIRLYISYMEQLNLRSVELNIPKLKEKLEELRTKQEILANNLVKTKSKNKMIKFAEELRRLSSEIDFIKKAIEIRRRNR